MLAFAREQLEKAERDRDAWRAQAEARLGNYLARHQDKICNSVKLVGYNDKKLKQKQWSSSQQPAAPKAIV